MDELRGKLASPASGKFFKGGAVMKIGQTSYYENLTAFLRMPPMSEYTVLSDAGFTVTAPNIAFGLTRLSKNNYELIVLWHGVRFVYNYGSVSEAVSAVRQLCDKHFCEAV